jgi:tetratricopeptide (TPR) repeat protein
MNAQTLFREGITAIREEKNLSKGRELLTQSLRLDADNDMAWLWLSRTLTDREKQRQCIERALKVNPNNQQAQTFMERLLNTPVPPFYDMPKIKSSLPPPEKPVDNDQTTIRSLLKKADTLIEQSDTEAAIEQWVRVLDVQPDHEEALGNAVRYLSRLKYMDDAHELVSNAIKCGTTHPSVYLTAIDIAKYQKNFPEADNLRVKLSTLPAADEGMIVGIVDHFLKNAQEALALQVLQNAVESHPKSQKMLIRLADLTKDQGRTQEAFELYESAASLGTRTKEGKAADIKLLEFAPSLTDKERGSTLLAIRESLGVGVLFLLMAWQDAGLNLLHLGINRWVGVLVATIGGYLAITATSSPAQQPLARLLGGVVPEAPEKPKDDFEAATMLPEHISTLPAITLPVRFILGSAGIMLMLLAFWLVFNTAIGLLNNPNPPEFYVPSCAEVFEVPGLC